MSTVTTVVVGAANSRQSIFAGGHPLLHTFLRVSTIFAVIDVPTAGTSQGKTRII